MTMRMIHIGCHKCGSTFIQDEVFPLLDKVIPAWCSDGAHGRYFSESVKEFFALVHSADLYFPDIRERVYGNLRQRFAEGDFVLSWEGFSGHGEFVLGQGLQIEPVARRLHDLFPEAGILIIIRNQRDLLRSLYRDEVTYGFCVDFEEWIRWKNRYHGLNYPRFSRLVETYQRFFGREKVKVGLFEEIFKPGRLRDLFASLDFDPAGVDNADFEKRLNRGFGSLGLRGMRFVNLHFGSKLNLCDKESWLYNRWRWRWAPRIDRWLAARSAAPDFAGFEEILRREYHADNERTSTLIGRDLMEAGYP